MDGVEPYSKHTVNRDCSNYVGHRPAKKSVKNTHKHFSVATRLQNSFLCHPSKAAKLHNRSIGILLQPTAKVFLDVVMLESKPISNTPRRAVDAPTTLHRICARLKGHTNNENPTWSTCQ